MTKKDIPELEAIIKMAEHKDEVVAALDKIAEDRHSKCDHGVVFDAEASEKMSVAEIRKAYPRHFGLCPKGCGYNGIAYASFLHYVSGDW